MSFYDTFELLCQKKGVTPTGAARDNDISQSVVGMWKKRGSVPKYETLKKLASYFNVAVDDLVTEREHAAAIVEHVKSKVGGKKFERVFPPPTSKERIISALDQLNADGQQKAVERVEELTEIPKYQRHTHQPESPSEGPQESK